ncbi:MAG: hypothetical protein K9G48_12690 [Reyranella sp.]|nr:hypothetical protein [Reyranella sp.]
MKLDRNTDGGQGKYFLILNRQLQAMRTGTFGDLPPDIAAALQLLKDNGLIDEGETGSEGEYFVLRLRDFYARPALLEYALAASAEDPEYGNEVLEMANRAGARSPFCKRPD